MRTQATEAGKKQRQITVPGTVAQQKAIVSNIFWVCIKSWYCTLALGVQAVDICFLSILSISSPHRHAVGTNYMHFTASTAHIQSLKNIFSTWGTEQLHTALTSHFRATYKWATASLSPRVQVSHRTGVEQGFRAALFSQRISGQLPGPSLGGTKLPVSHSRGHHCSGLFHVRVRTQTIKNRK